MEPLLNYRNRKQFFEVQKRISCSFSVGSLSYGNNAMLSSTRKVSRLNFG